MIRCKDFALFNTLGKYTGKQNQDLGTVKLGKVRSNRKCGTNEIGSQLTQKPAPWTAIATHTHTQTETEHLYADTLTPRNHPMWLNCNNEERIAGIRAGLVRLIIQGPQCVTDFE